jgi:anaerobic selenocysteine-containing dehydrogenase
MTASSAPLTHTLATDTTPDGRVHGESGSASRRDLLKGFASLAALATATGMVPMLTPMRPAAAQGAAAPGAAAPAAAAETIKSICVHCVNFCGIEVKKVGGVIRSIGTDPARRDVFNHGICPKGVAGAFQMYNPYRVKTPLKRTNPKKGLDQDPKWVEISWDEAFTTITERLQSIKATNPSKLIWQHGHGKYLIGDNFPIAFAKAFGTPNVIHRTTTCEAARHVADDLTWGYHGFLPDIERCNLFVVFGSNYFEAEQYARWMDHAVTDARERGMKVVVIEPRLSHVGAKADMWIPVRPGKDVAIVLALSKLLIDSGQIDTDFLVGYTNAPQLVGPDGRILRAGDKPLVWDTVSKSAKPFEGGVVPALRGSFTVDGKAVKTAFDVFADSLADMTPEAAGDIAGVPAETIRELAGMIAREARIGTTTKLGDLTHRYRPVMIHTWRGMTAREFGVQNWRSGLILQMLIGNPDAVGGLLLGPVNRSPAYMAPASCEYPPKRVDLAKSVYFPNGHHDVCQQVALTVLDPKAYGLTYEPEMQFFYATNRPVSTADTATQFRSMEKTFNVTIEIHMTETAWMSDIVLPDLGYLESWHFAPTRSHPFAKNTGIRQPIVNPYGLQHDCYTILWELAKRLGIRDAYIEAINAAWGLKDHKLEKGRDYSPREAVETIWLQSTGGKPFEIAVKDGFVASRSAPKSVYMGGVEDKFKGPGKPKMQLYADGMVGTLEKVKQTVEKNGIKNIDLEQYRIAYSPIPRKEHAFPTPHREAADMPFYLITFKSMYRNQMACSNTNPILNYALGKDTQENRVLINTTAAKKLGLADGDEVVIETRVGKVSGRCKFTEGIRPDTVGISYHYGHELPTFPAYARKGIPVNRVLELHPDRISGMNSFNDTKCRISKA